MRKKYVLPCAGYDRPGGNVSRAAAEELARIRDDVIIGSMGALYKERPGEMSDFRTSDVICLDGCGTQCASALAASKGQDKASIVPIPEVTNSNEDFEKKVKQVVGALSQILDETMEKESQQDLGISMQSIEYIEEKIDKFTLRVAKGHKYSDNDFWVRVEGQYVRVGVSDILQQIMSDVYFVELGEPGTHVDMFDDIGTMESTKILIEIIVPVSGTIIESNKSLEDNPEFINESPYEKGWIYLIEPDDIAELELLSDESEYLEKSIEKAKEEIGKKVK